MRKLSKQSLEKAWKFASRPYKIEAVPDRIDSDTPVVFVSNPELPGCNSHGATLEEAIENLEDARTLYIASILEDGLDVPPPEQIATDL